MHTFGSLEQETKARAELTKLQQEISKQAAIEIQVTGNQEASSSCAKYCISGFAEVKNVGSKNAEIRFPKDGPFTIQKLDLSDNRGYLFLDNPVPIQAPTGGFAAVVRVGVTERIPFIRKVPSPGVYLVTFEAETSEADREITINAGMPETAMTASWRGSRFIVVGDI